MTSSRAKAAAALLAACLLTISMSPAALAEGAGAARLNEKKAAPASPAATSNSQPVESKSSKEAKQRSRKARELAEEASKLARERKFVEAGKKLAAAYGEAAAAQEHAQSARLLHNHAQQQNLAQDDIDFYGEAADGAEAAVREAWQALAQSGDTVADELRVQGSQ